MLIAGIHQEKMWFGVGVIVGIKTMGVWSIRNIFSGVIGKLYWYSNHTDHEMPTPLVLLDLGFLPCYGI